MSRTCRSFLAARISFHDVECHPEGHLGDSPWRGSLQLSMQFLQAFAKFLSG